MSVDQKVAIDTVDITPSWEGVLPIYLAVIENSSSPHARKVAMDELRRMAKLADAYIASVRK